MEGKRSEHEVVTASSGVQTTYYGQPVIKAPHWRWLIIVYFFLGGIAGASFTIAAIADFFSRDRAVVRAARYVSVLAFLPCPLLLILDLGRPERFLNMLRVIKLKSPMSLGSWALFFAGGLSTLSGMLQLVADVTHRDILPLPRRLIGIAGIPFSVFLSGYSGVLLAATNIPLWWRASPFLSPTFISSAYSTSLAAISLFLRIGGGEHEAPVRRLARAEVACLTVELGSMTATVARLGKIGRPLTAGQLGAIFWPVTYVGGVLLPLLLQMSGPARGRAPSSSRHYLTTALTLVGGFSLRTLIIFAGKKSAAIPEDYFAMTSRPENSR